MGEFKREAGGERLKNKIFQSRDLCLRALDTNSLCAKNVRRNVEKNEKMETDKKKVIGRWEEVNHGAMVEGRELRSEAGGKK